MVVDVYGFGLSLGSLETSVKMGLREILSILFLKLQQGKYSFSLYNIGDQALKSKNKTQASINFLFYKFLHTCSYLMYVASIIYVPCSSY